jgi:hypothetical protein
MTYQPYDGATPEQLQSPFVREFLGIHGMFREQLAAMLEFVNELNTGEQQLTGAETMRRVQMLVRAGVQYTHMLHGHHHIETSSVFPVLHREGLEMSVVDRLNAEHDEIAVLIDKFSAAIGDYSTIEPEVMNHDLRRLSEALHAHLAYEETHICPFLARWINWPPIH